MTSTEKYVIKAKAIHGEEKFRYDITEFVSYRKTKKVKVFCIPCNLPRDINSRNHIYKKQGCKECHLRSIRTGFDEFVRLSKQVHGENTYDYSLVEYKARDEYVTLICNICGEPCDVAPDNHLRAGSGCNTCKDPDNIHPIQTVNPRERGNTPLTKEEAINRAITVHGQNKYNFADIEYNGYGKDIKNVYCNTCKKPFKIDAGALFKGSGCSTCGHEKAVTHRRTDLMNFIQEANQLHNNSYDYSEVDYKNCDTAVKIRCKRCSCKLEYTPYEHLRRMFGCSSCNASIMEKIAENYLIEMGLNYKKEYKMECKYVSHLRADYYLPDYNAVIELCGEQHFKRNKFFKDSLETVQKRDCIKTNYCREKGISMLRIAYKDVKKIDSFMTDFLSNIEEQGYYELFSDKELYAYLK